VAKPTAPPALAIVWPMLSCSIAMFVPATVRITAIVASTATIEPESPQPVSSVV
jgi:hypothetical protein